jgi:methionine-rich copper-binding protein CopC
MKKKALLIFSFLLAALTSSAQNQVFYNGFEEVQGTDTTALGWFQFINTQTGDTRDSVYTGAQYAGSNSCWFYNDAATEGSAWLRAIKFRNLPLKANTSYRLSFWLKGDTQYTLDGTTLKNSNVRATVMTGEEYADVQLLSADSTKFDYTSNVSSGDWKKYTYMFYYLGYDIQSKYFANHKSATSPDSVLKDKCFAAIYLYNPGDYYLDEVSMNESTIAGTYFNNDVIKVDFGYATNIATLAKSVNAGKLQLPTDCAKVTVNGSEVSIASVEVQSDGYLYIFLGDTFPQSESDNVTVSFTNPTGADQLLYTASLRPNSASESKAVLNFSDEKASFDENMTDVTSVAYDPPTLTSAEPEDGSFDLPLSTNSFTLNFDKPINIDKVTATLNGGSIKDEKMAITPASGFAQSVTLTRTGSTEFTSGEYSIKLDKIIGKLSYADEIFNTVNLTYNLGSKAADPNDTTYVVWRDSFNVLGQNYIPNQGWTFVHEGNEMTAGSQAGSGPRLFQFGDGGDVTIPMYIRCGTAVYGAKEDHPLTLKTGKYQIHYNCFGWKATPTLKFELLDANDNVILSRLDVCKPNVNGSKNAVTGSTSVTVDVKIPSDGNYKLRWTTVADDGTPNTSGMIEIMFGNCSVTYIPSVPGAYYKTMIANSLAAAKTVVVNDTSLRYAGPAYTSLKESIAKYEGKSFTAPSAYINGSNELNNAASAMTAHRKLIDTYDPMVSAAQAIIATYAGTKYANDASYPALQAMIDKYNGKALTQDDSLNTAIKELSNATTYCSNMCKYVIDDLNDRTAFAIATAKKLGIADDDADIVAAQASITDNDGLVQNINDKIRKTLYKNLADPADTTFTEKTDPNTLETYVDSINMTCFLKNPNLYVTAYKSDDVSDTACPGWKVKAGTGYALGWTVGWGAYDISATRPAEDAMMGNWEKSFEMSQTTTDLPVGVYTIQTGFGERNDVDATHLDYLNYFYVVANADSDSIKAPHVGQSFPTNNMTIRNIAVTDGKLTVGVKAAANSHIFLNNFSLYMIAKAPNFDYATNVRGINDTEKATLKDVEYYDVNGCRLNKIAKGITIIKWIYSNGKTVVTKKITR